MLTQAKVRAAVRNYDEDLPSNTIRAWTVGLLLTTLGAGINCLFSLRNPSIAITTYVVQLIAYPLGKGWDLVMPDKQHKLSLGWVGGETGLARGYFKVELRPAPFN